VGRGERVTLGTEGKEEEEEETHFYLFLEVGNKM